jgi:hypothetical protein
MGEQKALVLVGAMLAGMDLFEVRPAYLGWHGKGMTR